MVLRAQIQRGGCAYSQGRARLQHRSRSTAPENCLGEALDELLLIVSMVETCCHCRSPRSTLVPWHCTRCCGRCPLRVKSGNTPNEQKFSVAHRQQTSA